jgi:hypothetical protein
MRLGQSNIAVAWFTQGGTGKAGLTDVVMTVRSTPMSGTSTSTLYTGASAFEIGGGAYGLMRAASNFASATVVNYAATTTNTANVDAGACFGTCWAIAAAGTQGAVVADLQQVDSVANASATLRLAGVDVYSASGTAVSLYGGSRGLRIASPDLAFDVSGGNGGMTVGAYEVGGFPFYTSDDSGVPGSGNLHTNLDGGISGTVNVSVDPATIADAVWDESASGHTGTLTNVTRIDVATSTRATPADVLASISTGGNTFRTSYVDGAIQLVRGDSYSSGFRTPITIAQDGGNWPAMTGAGTLTCTLRMTDKYTDANASGCSTATLSVSYTGSGTAQSLLVAPTSTQTANLAVTTSAPGLGLYPYDYDVQYYDGTNRATLASGGVDVVEDQTTT